MLGAQEGRAPQDCCLCQGRLGEGAPSPVAVRDSVEPWLPGLGSRSPLWVVLESREAEEVPGVPPANGAPH